MILLKEWREILEQKRDDIRATSEAECLYHERRFLANMLEDASAAVEKLSKPDVFQSQSRDELLYFLERWCRLNGTNVDIVAMREHHKNEPPSGSLNSTTLEDSGGRKSCLPALRQTLSRSSTRLQHLLSKSSRCTNIGLASKRMALLHKDTLAHATLSAAKGLAGSFESSRQVKSLKPSPDVCYPVLSRTMLEKVFQEISQRCRDIIAMLGRILVARETPHHRPKLSKHIRDKTACEDETFGDLEIGIMPSDILAKHIIELHMILYTGGLAWQHRTNKRRPVREFAKKDSNGQ